MKFRKKPIIVDAIQYDGKNFKEILEFIGGKKDNEAIFNKLHDCFEKQNLKEDDKLIMRKL